MMQKPAVRIVLAVLVLLVFIIACVVAPIFFDFGLGAGDGSNDEAEETITVAAASDLIPAFEAIGDRFNEETEYEVEFTFGASGMLAQQVESGAPVDVYVSANEDYVRQLDDQDLLIDDSIAGYALGRIVVYALDEEIEPLEDLEALRDPEIERIAIANPDHAPYGVAAREALQSAGLWDELRDKLVLGGNIRETMQYAETGNVDVAIVAHSLAEASDEGQWTLIPDDRHQPINQTLGIVADTDHEDAAREFVRFVTGDAGRQILADYGFEFPHEARE